MAPPTFPFRVFVANFILLLAIAFPPVHLGDPKTITLESIDPPPIQCGQFTFRWKGGTPPFFVDLVQQGGSNQQRHLGPTNLSYISWGSDLAAGTVLEATVSDIDSGTGKTKIETFTVQSGTDAVCLGVSTTSIASSPPSTTPSSINPGPGSPTTDTSAPTQTTSTSMSPPTSLSIPTTPPESPAPSAVPTNTSTLLITNSHSQATSSSRQLDPPAQTVAPDADIPRRLTSTITSWDTKRSPVPSYPDPTTISNPLASNMPQQTALAEPSKRGRVAGVIIGCLVTALLGTLGLMLLRKRNRARERSRIASMTTLNTLAFTATTWSDLSPPEADKPLGANKGVAEWRADLFARSHDTSDRSLKQQQPAQPSPWVPFTAPHAHVPFRRGAPVTSLSTIPEASAESSMPSPVESDDSTDTAAAPSLRSYPPLVPRSVGLPQASGDGDGNRDGDRRLRQHVYPPAAPPSAQVPVNPFRARLLAAGRNGGAWARSDGSGEDPFR